MKTSVEVLVAFVIAAAAIGMFVTTCSVSEQSPAEVRVIYDTVWRDTTIVIQRPTIRFTARARVVSSDSVISDTTTTDSSGNTTRIIIMTRTQIASIDTSLFGTRYQIDYNSLLQRLSLEQQFAPDTLAIATAQINKTIEKMLPRPWWEPPAYVAGGTIVGAIVVLVMRGAK